MIRCENGKCERKGELIDVIADVCCVIEDIVADLAKKDVMMTLPVRGVIDFAIKHGIEKAKKGENNE